MNSAKKKYFEKAANNGHVMSQLIYGLMCIENDNVNEGNKYMLRAAENGNDMAMLYIGKQLYEGKGFKMDKNKGLSYLKKAAESGNKEAMFDAAVIIQEDDDVEVDRLQIFKETSRKWELNSDVSLCIDAIQW